MPPQGEDREAASMEHRINPTQLDRILFEIRKKKHGRINLHDIVQIIQMAALVAGGIWALFEFRTFKSENSRLTLEQQRFAVQQQEIGKEQQKLSLEMAKVSLAYQEKQDALSGLALSKSKQKRREFNSDLTAKPVSPAKNNVFCVDVEFKVTNTSDAEFVVTYSLIEIFIAEPVPMLRTNLDVITIPTPPAITDGVYNPKTAAGLKWKKLAGKAHVYQDGAVHLPPFFSNAYPNPIIGGGGTLSLKAGESTTGSMTLLVKAHPDAWVGAVVKIGFDERH
jgi:hypothetical protein